MAHTAFLVCFIFTVNVHSKQKRKKGCKCGAISGHITNLKQSIFSFDIYGLMSVIDNCKPATYYAILLICDNNLRSIINNIILFL